MPVTRIAEFDTWHQGYGLATIHILRAGTTLLADVYQDEACTVIAANPQRLLEKTSGGVSQGKFAAPVYTRQAYECRINSVDATGILRPPITSLDSEDASKALVTVDGGDVAHELEDFLGRSVDVRDYGTFAPVGDPLASPDGNANALAGAIGTAAMKGIHFVDLPAGTYDVAPFTIPTGIIVRGQGREKTILQCGQGGKFVTITGNRAGIMALTLDGKTKVVTSCGFYAIGRNQVLVSDAEIKRFEKGAYFQGGLQILVRDSDITDCSIGLHGAGDNANVGGALGSSLQNFAWRGGKVSYCSTAGLLLEYLNMPVIEAVIDGVGFIGNSDKALQFKGGRNAVVRNCWFDQNLFANLDARNDDANTPAGQLIGLLVEQCRFVRAKFMVWNTAKGIHLRRCVLELVTVELVSVSSPVAVEDCQETSVILTLGGFYWMRRFSAQRGQTVGVTTAAVTSSAWSQLLAPGQALMVLVKAIGRARNANKRGYYAFLASAVRGYDTLAYDNQTGQFTPGNVITGQTSGATARVVVDVDGGTTGTLSLQDTSGTFLDNEIITDGVGGSAQVNGLLTVGTVALAGAQTNLMTAIETVAGWDVLAVAGGQSLDIRVTGEALTTIDWTVDVDITSS